MSAVLHHAESDVVREPAPTRRSSPVVAFVVLMALYTLFSLFASPAGHLSTDVGGKTASLEAMVDRGDWSVDIGYWAADADPEGLAHPYANTMAVGNGWWVNTTSLPMVLAARPLWQLGGPQLVLVLPMLAAAGAAVVAGRLQERLRPERGNAAMWVVGLATPLTVYALDFWEHSIGVFCMALGSLWVLTAADDDAPGARRIWAAAFAGVAFGFAATMRQEALVYGFVAGLALTASLLAGTGRTVTQYIRSCAASIAMAAATLGVLVAHSVAETWYYGEPLRSSRSLNAATAAGGGLGARIDDAFTVTLSPINAIHPIATVFGTALLVGLAWLMIAIRKGGEIKYPAVLVVALATVLLLRFVQFGPTFVPGLLPTTPLAIAGVACAAVTKRHRLIWSMAMLPIPIVYATQYVGGAVPQWGGRYLLMTGFLLVVLACTELPRQHRAAFRGLVIASIAVTMVGVSFNAQRSHAIADDFELVQSVSDGEVVVWFDPMKAREGGPSMLGQRWLSSVGGAQDAVVLDILEGAGIDRFVYLDPVDDPAPVFAGFAATSALDGVQTSTVLNLRITVFERSTP